MSHFEPLLSYCPPAALLPLLLLVLSHGDLTRRGGGMVVMDGVGWGLSDVATETVTEYTKEKKKKGPEMRLGPHSSSM